IPVASLIAEALCIAPEDAEGASDPTAQLRLCAVLQAHANAPPTPCQGKGAPGTLESVQVAICGHGEPTAGRAVAFMLCRLLPSGGLLRRRVDGERRDFHDGTS